MFRLVILLFGEDLITKSKFQNVQKGRDKHIIILFQSMFLVITDYSYL
jgi:hypothetical protein